MSRKFMKLLNLNSDLEKKLSLFKVTQTQHNNENYYKLYFETSDTLSIEDVTELLRNIIAFNRSNIGYDRIRFKSQEVYILNNKAVTKEYELYTFIRYLMNHFSSVDADKYFVEMKNENDAIIYTNDQKVKNLLDRALVGIKVFLDNFGIYKGNINVVNDESQFDYSHIHKKIESKKETMFFEQVNNPEPADDYTLVNTLTIKEDLEKSYFEGKVFSADKRTTKNG
jgi:hypothetical protein